MNHSFITSGLGGWGWKIAIFAVLQFCIFADMGGWVQKVQNVLT